MDITNIFVVYDPTIDEQPALERASAIADEVSANLHVFACIYSEEAAAADDTTERESLLAAQQDTLTRKVQALVDRGARVTTEVEWDKDWYQAIVNAVQRYDADVVLKSSYKHTAHQRILNKTSDWTLIRNCSCPVLLVKAGSQKDVRKVLAAIDTRIEKEAYEKLNQNILDFSKRFMQGSDTEVHFVSAHKNLSTRPDRGALIRRCGVDSDRVHIKLGEPEEVIVENAIDLDASLVVIGNSGRSGLSAVVKGNTVEKVLDRLECDILAMP
jgi:universal stress protein E